MTRTEAIAIIQQSIPSADEATLAAAAKLFESARSDLDLGRPLTAQELASINDAKEDFKAGRTFTSAQGQAYNNAELARRRAERAARG
jgi:hypothetical protein